MTGLDGLSILVVEDEVIIAMALEDGLIAAGADPVSASTIEQANEIIHSGRRIDAAILDVNVHGRNSYEIASLLEERGIRFVFASGYGNTAAPPELAHVRVFTKPYDVNAIGAALLA
ncbi:response regulator [Tsuneonella troitsensis]|uniref:response regulator n=1 Tax=Tsuneonella troitsensis TaxID=292222 RepID=UPI00070CB96D|nr:response regulator [Tsuneonella troitsensis]